MESVWTQTHVEEKSCLFVEDSSILDKIKAKFCLSDTIKENNSTMEMNQVLVFIGVIVWSGVCANNSGLSYTDSLVGGLKKAVARPLFADKNVVDNSFHGFCPLDCPLGTRCSLEFGAPRCVGAVDTGLGGYLGNNRALDLYSQTADLDTSLTKERDLFGFGRCAPMTPGCLATRFDRIELCRFTFDLRQQRCVRVYVRNVCAIFDSPHQNLFSSRFDCEQSCAGGKLSY
ncbi:hypothetical protein RRG08_027126 [Elysia crispata]|uniref:Uncharacterized protein n=1 Tax=Elysia crispata TaxID=231223 RepID=A0AAE0YVP7_9GAST|nr:hypothetical protein RRG08_027126 [Elysia crispata]